MVVDSSYSGVHQLEWLMATKLWMLSEEIGHQWQLFILSETDKKIYGQEGMCVK